MSCYRVAEVDFEICGYRCERIAVMPNFRPFEREGCRPKITIELVEEYDDMDESDTVYSLKNEAAWYCCVRPTAEEFGFKILGTGGLDPLSVRYRVGEERVVVGGCGDGYTLLFAMWLAYGVVALRHGVVSIHTSCVEYRGRAVMFLGESGTGKSTHSRMWLEGIEGVELLNDDSPMLRASSEGIYIYGSPWSGKTPCYRDIRRELAGVVRLSQAKQNKIRRHNVISAFAALYPSTPPVFMGDERLSERVCALLSQTISQCGVWHLEALPNVDAAMVSREAIFGEAR